jgi:type VI secretion system protein ImpI/type VI secretion system protein
MPLVLTTLRCPEGVAPEHREVTRDAFSIGRGTESDWVLPDPDRVLSKRHCQITARGDGWVVRDSSANGTFLNGSTLETDLPHPLRDHDRLAFGKYELEVRIGDALRDEPGEAPLRFGVRSDGVNETRLTGDPFSSLVDDPLEAVRPSVGLPLDFDALNADDRVAENPYAAPDHTPDLQANFRAPRPSLELLPEDWDLDAAPASAPEPSAPPSVAAVPPPAPPQPAAGLAAANTADQAGFAAFAAGAGVAGAAPADANEALRTLGAAFRAVVSGLRRIMIARATIKGEFRIEQTMIRATGNNPLKFSADDDDALAALLGVGRQGGMGPEGAIAEALRDMRLHELAVTAAMQRAVRDVLAELEPERVIRGVRRSTFDGLFGRRKQAGWDAYAARHAEITRALADEFDSVFGKSFVRAYESALASISEQDAP